MVRYINIICYHVKYCYSYVDDMAVKVLNKYTIFDGICQIYIFWSFCVL